jgi:hypothetical protein
LVDANLHFQDRKALQDHLNATFGASDACGEVNIMESFHDYKMVGNRSIVEQAQEVQRTTRELELIVSYLTSLWSDALLQFASFMEELRQNS